MHERRRERGIRETYEQIKTWSRMKMKREEGFFFVRRKG